MPTTLKAYRADGTEVRPGDTLITLATDLHFTFHAAVRVTDPARDGAIQATGAGYPFPQQYPAGLFGLTVRAAAEPELKAYREGGTEVRPGDTISMGSGDMTFRAAVSTDGRAGMIAVDGYSDMFASPFGLTVRAADEPAQHGVWCECTPSECPVNQPETSDRSEPVPAMLTLDEALTAVSDAQYGDDYVQQRELTALRYLAAAVRAQVAPAPDADELAADAERTARTTAPPVPGITENAGFTVYAVLPAGFGSWYVAARRDSDGERVTWLAETCPGGTLAFSNGHYITRGQSSDDEALADLAHRAGVFSALDRLASGMATREAYLESHAKVLDELSGVHGVGRAKVRAGLLEAATLGYARISWHEGSTRRDYGIRYDRYRCTFSWHREN
jgi:hypothetical protein